MDEICNNPQQNWTPMWVRTVLKIQCPRVSEINKKVTNVQLKIAMRDFFVMCWFYPFSHSLICFGRFGKREECIGTVYFDAMQNESKRFCMLYLACKPILCIKFKRDFWSFEMERQSINVCTYQKPLHRFANERNAEKKKRTMFFSVVCQSFPMTTIKKMHCMKTSKLWLYKSYIIYIEWTLVFFSATDHSQSNTWTISNVNHRGYHFNFACCYQRNFMQHIFFVRYRQQVVTW